MPFLDKDIQRMCVIDHYDDFMRLFRELTDINKILELLPSDKDDENYDTCRDDLMENKAEVLNSMREHKRLHLYAWNGSAFVYCNKVSVEECQKRVDDMVDKREAYLKKIAEAEAGHGNAIKKLDKLKSDTIEYTMTGMTAGYWDSKLAKTPSLSGMELLVRRAWEEVEKAKDEFAKYERELDDAGSPPAP